MNSAVQFEEILQSYIDAVNREPEEVDIIVFYFSGLANEKDDKDDSDSSFKTYDDDDDDDELMTRMMRTRIKRSWKSRQKETRLF